MSDNHNTEKISDKKLNKKKKFLLLAILAIIIILIMILCHYCPKPEFERQYLPSLAPQGFQGTKG
jgi:flagellar biosynthesis/type III secretory pathway M-ring protein FliF/YscJ